MSAFPAITEREFQRQVIQLAKHLGWWVYHTHDARRSEPGFPDLVLIHPKHGIIFVELKTDTGRVRPEQRDCLGRIIEAGGRAYLWRPRDWPTIENVLGVKRAA